MDGGKEDIVDQLVLPVQCRHMVLEVANNIPMAGHLGKKTLDRIQQCFYWPSMFHDVSEYCKSYDACQKSARKKLARKAKMIPLPIIDVPFKRIAMDIVGPLDRSESGCCFILVICDYTARFLEAAALKSIEATVIAEELMKLFSRVGMAEEIRTEILRFTTC